jgi:hypothetical protein
MQENLYRAPTDSRPQFCFNPACPSPTHRMFLPSDGPQYHTTICTKWFADAAIVTRLNNLRRVDVTPQKDEAMLFTAPVQAMLKVFERKQSLAAKISNMYEDMKQSVVECINSCKAGKLEELEFLSKQLENFRSLVLEGVALSDSKKEGTEEYMRNVSVGINSLINSHKYALPAFKNLELYNQTSFTQMSASLKSHILSLGNCFCKEEELDGGM